MSAPWTYSALPSRPASCWPGGQKIAVWVAIGLESYRDSGRTEDILPRGPEPDLVNAAWRDYGNRVGAFRLFDRLGDAGIRPAVLVNSDLCDTAPEALAAARASGAEVVAHGMSNSDCLTEMTELQERDYIAACRARIASSEGIAPAGWSSPWLQHSPATLKHLYDAGFDYVLDFGLDDQPVWLDAGAGQILSIPYDTELNDSTSGVGRYVDGRQFAGMIGDACDELVDAAGDQALVMSIVLHSFISGQPYRLRPLMQVLERLASSEHLWFATPREIYAAVRANPDLAAGRKEI